MTGFAEKLADETRPIIIGEIAQAHDGSLGMAHAYIDALADAGADAIKFQTHIADQESTLDEQFRIKFSYQDETRYDYWRRMEFTEAQWAELKFHADQREIAFLSTPFSVAAIEMLKRIDVPAWKIGSGDTSLQELLLPVLATKKPIIMSSGMSAWKEIDSYVAPLRDAKANFALMQCTSMYPTPLADVGLNNLDEIKTRYGCRVGLSDHSGKLAPALTAIARGYSLIEVHATFDKRMFGPDVAASLTIEEIAQLAQFGKDVTTLDKSPVDKDVVAGRLDKQKSLFGRSVGLVADLPEGHMLTEADLLPKKPGDGIPWSEKKSQIGRKLRHAVTRNRLLKQEDFQ